MKKIHPYFTLWISAVLLSSCLQEVDLTDVNTDHLLVVDAMITDQTGTQTVKLSRTTSLASENAFLAEENAVIWLEGDHDIFDFTETEPGIYTSAEDFGAVAGVSYYLHIETTDGKEYLSDPVQMSPTPAMDSVYMEFESAPTMYNAYGGNFSIYADARNISSDARFFRWIWNSTYEVTVPFPSRWLWTGGNTFAIRELGSENDSLQVEKCWTTDTSTTITLLELLDGESSIIRQPIHSFHSDEGAMKIRYSIEVKQYALSEASYQFWKLIAESTSGGFLFDTQVGTIAGNMHNVNHADEPVLGFFEVVQEQSIRRFYTPSDFRKDGYWAGSPFFVDCDEVEPEITTLDQIGEFMEQNYYYYTLCYFITDPPTAAFYRLECSDCLKFGETNQKPDFWP